MSSFLKRSSFITIIVRFSIYGALRGDALPRLSETNFVQGVVLTYIEIEAGFFLKMRYFHKLFVSISGNQMPSSNLLMASSDCKPCAIAAFSGFCLSSFKRKYLLIIKRLSLCKMRGNAPLNFINFGKVF